MKNKLLAASLLSALAMPAFANYAVDGEANTGTGDDADDLQSVSVTVPEVALLDIKDGTGTDGNTNTIIITAPTTAGEGFTGSATLGVTYALSSNVAAVAAGGNSTARRKISASLNSDLPENWQLSATMDAAGGTSSSAGEIVFTGATPVDLLTGIGNEKTGTTDRDIAYKLGPTNEGDMMAYEENRSITVTYTLSGDA